VVTTREPTLRRGRRAQERAAAARGKSQRRIVAVTGGVIVLIVVGMIAARLVLNSQTAPVAAEAPVPPDVLQAITQVPSDPLEAVGVGSVTALPAPTHAQIALGPNGVPLITYIGAEYCPFCAGERWPLIVALSRFGTFSNLRITTSAADDVYPSTPTFTFYGAQYTSQYVDFSSVELQSNVKSGGQYAPLQSPTPDQEQLLRLYDAPPYVPASSAGAIPFLDVANLYVTAGASFDVGVLQGHSWQEIAANLSDANTDQAKGILGTANVLTAAICQSTANTPAGVCSSPTIQALESRLGGAQPAA
jgi:hypothetical protein